MSYNVIPDPTTYNSATPDFTLGEEFTYRAAANQMWKLRYVQFKDAVTYAAGQVLTWANATATAVTNDRSGGSSVGNQCAGIALCAVTENYYGFVLTEGYYSAVVTNGDDDIAAGDALIVATGTDGACDSSASASNLKIGQALAADVDGSNTVAAWIKV